MNEQIKEKEVKDDYSSNPHYPKYLKKCDECGIEYKCRHKTAHYCSDKCKNKAFIKRRMWKNKTYPCLIDHYIMECVECKTHFIAKRRDNAYCSDKCKQKSHRNETCGKKNNRQIGKIINTFYKD